MTETEGDGSLYIPMERLAEELQKRAGVQTYNVEGRVVTDIRMLPVDFDPAVHTLSEDICYVCDYRKLRIYDPHVDLAPLICVMEPGAQHHPVFFSNRTAITVTGLRIAELMEMLIGIVYEFGGRSSPMAETACELLHCTGIQPLMEKGLELLGNPLILTDDNQKIIASADHGSVSEAPYSDILAMEYLPVGHPWLEENEFSVKNADDHPVVCEGRDRLPTVMVKRLRVGGKTEGYLHVFQFNRPFAREDTPVVDLLGSLLAVELHARPAPRGVNRKVQETERFLQDVLNNMRDEEYILQGQRYIGLKFKRFIHTIVIYARKTELFPPISYYDLSKRMADMLPDCFGFLFRNSILLLLSSDEEIGDFGELLQDVRPIMEKYNLIAGISNSFGSILGLSAHCFQSCKALQLGSVLHPEKTLYSYRDYSVYYMIELCLKNDDLTAFCLPEIAKLIEHSKKDSGDLLNTLRIYLRCGRSKSQTAREMFVHLNTVKYRLQQIQSIIGLDFDNDDNALKLMLSFKMLEYKEKFQSYEPMDIMGR